MLKVTIPSTELWDEQTQEFITSKEQTLTLEHSLVSVSKWESKWCKPFLTKESKTMDEYIDYIKCMVITQNVDPDVFRYLTNENVATVSEYIESPMTATWFSSTDGNKPIINREQITSELIYYWMVAYNIPFECQKWNLNRLFTLIKICNIKNQPNKKRSGKEIMSRNAALNAARRKKLNTRG